MRLSARATTIAAAGTALVAAVTLSGGAAFAADTDAPPNSSHFTQGFDVSSYQSMSESDFVKAKSNGATFVYIKAGQTKTNQAAFQQDSKFTTYWQDAISAGLVPGAYFFVGIGDGNKNHIAADFNPKTEAENMITAATRTPQVQPSTLPPVIDLETGTTTTCRLMANADWNRNLAANQKTMVQWIQTFSSVIKSGFGGRTPIIYTTKTFWSTCTGNSTAFAANRLWIASPTAVGSKAVRPSVTGMGFSNFLLWQWRYDASKVPPGFPGDQDVLNTAVSSLAALSTPPIPTTSAPTIGGTVRWHQTATAKPGTWTSGTTFTYQWYRNGVAIPGATSANYFIASADVGKTLTVHVDGHHTGYSSVVTASKATAKVTT